ncbi:unnamed protein product [marine sediment metagenome]|uniref:Uncharacterized protein n=1 Tax=marine sediment metagenome TaxID=412755 RepID=X0UYF1_9ZZZZ
MNLKRVMIFTALMFAAMAAIAVPFSLIQRSLILGGDQVPLWLTVGPVVAVTVAAGWVFFSLAAREPERPYEHAWAVWGVSMAIAFCISVLVIGVPIGYWLLNSIPFALALLVGVPLGRRHPKGAA